MPVSQMRAAEGARARSRPSETCTSSFHVVKRLFKPVAARLLAVSKLAGEPASPELTLWLWAWSAGGYVEIVIPSQTLQDAF